MKKSYNSKRNRFLTWLIYNYLTDFIFKEMSFQIYFIENGNTVARQIMYTVPHIGSKVDINDRFFLVKDIIYSSHGSANKVVGKFI